MKRNPDNRDDNVARIQESIDGTMKNMREASSTIRATSSDKTRDELIAKNERREEALDGFRSEIKDEAEHLRNKKS
ncbi:small acid-soluble spore protein (thioredoxin-like protein) [Sporobacter termitidis DSM 10068]|uniref:Protein Tlp homolog n=1 Tax=Sporobacter termitidis DSM 10068 TaxID=1123282 RepID=A0A1M5ZAD5_9FIRM|nr:small acid-soluble spore protein Tlp [Sporobacter termitidis]SHI21098.1 small acid-soluble spore protein (thioredoxin-like protein) [Sporobacter termitidis DSM 10068]